jgi:hypothetical protein
MMRDNARPGILQPMKQSVELLKAVSALQTRATAAPSSQPMIRSRCYGSPIPESVAALK